MLDKLEGKVMVFDFGEKDGIKRYRVNGLKPELENLIHWLEENSYLLYSPATIEQSRPYSLHTVLLEIIIPEQ
jgi:hypothetical protein